MLLCEDIAEQNVLLGS
jgi:hypothetical protein